MTTERKIDDLPNGVIKTAQERYDTAYRWAAGLSCRDLAQCLRVANSTPRFYSIQQRRALCNVAADLIEST